MGYHTEIMNGCGPHNTAKSRRKWRKKNGCLQCKWVGIVANIMLPLIDVMNAIYSDPLFFSWKHFIHWLSSFHSAFLMFFCFYLNVCNLSVFNTKICFWEIFVLICYPCMCVYFLLFFLKEIIFIHEINFLNDSMGRHFIVVLWNR